MSEARRPGPTPDHWRVWPALAWVALLLAAPWPHGCHYVELASGQLELVNGQVPLAQARAREIDPARRRLLALAPDVVAFGRDVMQLRPGRSYTGYYETERRGVVYVVSASERLRLQPHLFSFPIVGEVAYQSFFVEAHARQAADALQREGYDVYLGAATAYSTLGFLRDPVTTIMMRRGTVAYIEVLLHEMTHGRLYVAGHSDFSEQLASFAAERGVERYVRAHHADDYALQAELARHLTRRRSVEREVLATVAALERLYAAGGPAAQVLAARELHFARLRTHLAAHYPDATPDELLVNNARLLQYSRYLASAPEVAGLWKRAGGSFVRFWPLVEAHAASLR